MLSNPIREYLKDVKSKRELYCPFAMRDAPSMKTRDRYSAGYPVGAVVHYTGGRSYAGDLDAVNAVSYGADMGHTYFCISSLGTIYQTFPLDLWGYHAGKSYFPTLGESLSTKLVGIEVCSAGLLSKDKDGNYVSWFGEKYPVSDIRDHRAQDNIKKGVYHVFTSAQEMALLKLIMWLKINNPDIFQLKNVFGHDEISSHKNDPGASLSMSMPKYREFIHSEYDSILREDKGPLIPFALEEVFGAANLQMFLNQTFDTNIKADGVPGPKTSAAFYSVFGHRLHGDPKLN